MAPRTWQKNIKGTGGDGPNLRPNRTKERTSKGAWQNITSVRKSKGGFLAKKKGGTGTPIPVETIKLHGTAAGKLQFPYIREKGRRKAAQQNSGKRMR